MLWLWILGVLMVLLILLCLLQVGVRVDLQEQTEVLLFVGPVRIRLFPAKEKKTEEKTAPDDGKKTKTAKEKRMSVPKPNWEDIKDAYRTLKPVVLKTLERTRRGIRIQPLDISVVFGGREDPARAAECYGYANAAVWTVMPVLEQLLVIPEPHIHVGTNFETDKLQLRGTAGIWIRVGTLLLLALGLAIPAVRWFIKYRKKKMAETTTNQQPAQLPAA